MPPSSGVLLNRLSVRAKFRHMQVFVKLAEVGSMRRTAEAVNMTQPAISQIVSELERLLETELFFRHARGVALTEVARDLLPVAQRILGALEDGAEKVAHRLHEQGGVVRVAASPAAIGGLLHDRLDEFARKHPDIQVHIVPSADAAPLAGVADGSADIICTRQPAAVPEGWAFVECLPDQLTAVCGHTHPLAGQEEVDLGALGSERWLMNRVGSVARDRFEEIAQRHDWPMSSRCQIVMHIPGLTREMLLTGRYLALLPRSIALSWLRSGEICELAAGMRLDLPPLGFVWSEAASGAATRAFARHLAR